MTTLEQTVATAIGEFEHILLAISSTKILSYIKTFNYLNKTY